MLVVLGILVAVNYIGKRQNKRWDLTAPSSTACRIRPGTSLSKLDSPLDILVFAQEPSSRGTGTG